MLLLLLSLRTHLLERIAGWRTRSLGWVAELWWCSYHPLLLLRLLLEGGWRWSWESPLDGGWLRGSTLHGSL